MTLMVAMPPTINASKIKSWNYKKTSKLPIKSFKKSSKEARPTKNMQGSSASWHLKLLKRTKGSNIKVNVRRSNKDWGHMTWSWRYWISNTASKLTSSRKTKNRLRWWKSLSMIVKISQWGSWKNTRKIWWVSSNTCKCTNTTSIHWSTSCNLSTEDMRSMGSYWPCPSSRLRMRTRCISSKLWRRTANQESETSKWRRTWIDCG